VLPPGRVLGALARLDPFPTIGGPLARVPAPNATVVRRPGVRAAAASVLKITGTACGLGVEGSGWVARPGLVVTAAHVVAGEDDTRVHVNGGALSAQAVAFDTRNDVAVLRVAGLTARPLQLVDPSAGTAVAVLGYPEDGPLTATAARIGATMFLLTEDAYGRGPVGRVVTTLRGSVQHGDSGGPAVDARGAVQTTVYASRVGGSGGFGVPASAVRRALVSAGAPVSTGPCVQ
jgi:S1-C subfamily serine protease